MKKKTLLTVLCMAFVVFGMMSSASALTINPNTTPQWSGNQTGTRFILDYINTQIPGFSTLNELYKQNTDSVADTGPFAPLYSTSFSGDPNNATITYSGDGEHFISGSPLYLLVKDGSASPSWYLFDLRNINNPALGQYGLSWNGTETLYLTGFWPGPGGSISHVAIYGTPSQNVPEPGTMLLLGFGLLGVAGVTRFRN
jgi:hypothetical protein